MGSGTARSTTVRAIVVAAALMAGGCGSDGSDGTDGSNGSSEGTREDGAVELSTEDVAARAAEILDVPTDRVVVDPPLGLTPACRIHAAWSADSLDPHPLSLAELPDGSLVDDRTDGAAEVVLRACYLDGGITPDPASAAAVITRLGAVGGPVVVADPGPARRRLGELGIDWEEPSLTEGDDGSTIRFYAENLELGRLLRVTARLATDGTLTVEAERL